MQGGWTFEASLSAFLVLAFLSQAAAALSRSRVSLPLALGLLCTGGLALGLLPKDIAVLSRMKEVGIIAFNVLIIHGGTSIGAGMGQPAKPAVKIILGGSLALVITLGLILGPLAGLPAALYAAGPVLGGGAAAAIASNAAFRAKPELAVLPWLIFMFQGLFGLPVFAWALHRDLLRQSGMNPAGAEARTSPEAADSMPPDSPQLSLCEGLPRNLRGTAYYLGGLMLAAWLNRILYTLALSKLGIHPALSALLLGALLARLGIFEREPLFKSDAFGLLMLGLMALMVDTLSTAGIPTILRLVPTALAALTVGTLALASAGALLGRFCLGNPWRGIAMVVSAQVGQPGYVWIARGILASAGGGEEERKRREAEILPLLDASHALSANFAAIALSSLAGLLAGIF